jgi:hypothetical protein
MAPDEISGPNLITTIYLKSDPKKQRKRGWVGRAEKERGKGKIDEAENAREPGLKRHGRV